VRILLVEDSPEVGANVSEGLEGLGHAVDVAPDGATGLRLAVGGDYGLVILDRMLPRLDGLEVCRRLRAERGEELPVLFLTARDELEDKLEAFEARAEALGARAVRPERMRCCMPGVSARARARTVELPSWGRQFGVDSLVSRAASPSRRTRAPSSRAS
jgi:DNA-binding response OmpR family regulator